MDALVTVAASGTRHRASSRGRRLGVAASCFESEHGAQPAEAGLGFIHDEQHAPLVKMLAHAPEYISGGAMTPPAENGLGDQGAQRTDGLLVDKLEADVEAGESHTPSMTAGHRYAYGAGIAKAPGSSGPYPECPIE